MRYFVSGHRDLTQEEFNKYYIPLIQKVINEDTQAEFIVGDWEGCDSMFVEYIKDYPNIIVNVCYKSNNVNYEPRVPRRQGVAIFLPTYDECDEYMTYDSDFDIAWIRPGREDSHTAKNIKRRYGF